MTAAGKSVRRATCLEGAIEMKHDAITSIM